MLPRGEVGLIFATIGLQNGVLGDDLYAALLLVVLVTTLVTPQLLKVRYHRLRAAAQPVGTPATPRRPREGGWGSTPTTWGWPAAPRRAGGPARARRRDLPRPPATSPRAPRLADGRRARDKPVDRPSSRPRSSTSSSAGNERSWRFLETTGVLDAALPELARAFHRRAGDSSPSTAGAANGCRRSAPGSAGRGRPALERGAGA